MKIINRISIVALAVLACFFMTTTIQKSSDYEKLNTAVSKETLTCQREIKS